MSYTEGREKWTGATPNREIGHFVCDECGTDEIFMVSHFDGRDIYGYDYNCKNGHHIRRTIKRREGETWEVY